MIAITSGTVVPVRDWLPNCLSANLINVVPLGLYDSLHISELNLNFPEDHLCWLYQPWSKKGLLAFRSKLMKSASATDTIDVALTSNGEQYCRTGEKRFPRSLSYKRSGCTLRRSDKNINRSKDSGSCEGSNRNLAVVSYISLLSHTMKEVSSSFGINATLSAQNSCWLAVCHKVHGVTTHEARPGVCVEYFSVVLEEVHQ